MKKAIWRLIKVVYVLFLLLGLGVTIFAWMINKPYSYTTYGYKVECDNGKVFDPTSKPISREYNYDKPDSFNSLEIMAECENGSAWDFDNLNLKEDNNILTYKEYPHIVTTQADQIDRTIITFIAYYLILELIRRTFMYIFKGTPFVNIKKLRFVFEEGR